MPIKNRDGYILIVTYVFLVILTVIVGTLAFMATHETRDIGAQIEDGQMIYLAEAGVERALREIRNDYTTTTQTGTATIRGATATAGGAGVSNVTRIPYVDDSNATISSSAATATANLTAFDANYVNTRIVSVSLGARASRNTGGTGATLELSYATDGVFPSANTKLTVALPNSTTLANYSQDITADRSWTWSTIMSSNFTLRAIRTAGDRNLRLDAIYLIVTYEIDTGTEAWSTGSYQTYPISLGKGTIQSVSIIAEQGKVHINTAPQALLRYLMEEYGIDSATSNTVATNIVNYQAGNNFDSVEELQQVTGMTSTIYNAIKGDVTVYSFINTNVQRPTGARAPININTASSQVLRAVFDALPLGAGDAASLATDIINTRATTPFTCFYSSDSAVTTDFFDFVTNRAYLDDSDKQDNVLDNADASSLIPVNGSTGVNLITAEFSYDTNAFYVQSLANINGRGFRIKTILGELGNKTFTNFAGDTTSTGYRQENYE